MNHELEELYAEQEQAQKKLEQAQNTVRRLENRKRYLEDGARKARAHRLITRGAAVESILPAVQSMPERAFYKLMETVLTLPEAQSVIQSRLPKKGGDP